MSLAGIRVQMLLDNALAPDPRVEREACVLRDSGAAVHVLCWDRDGTAPHREERDGFTIERIVTPSRRQLGIRQLRNLARFYRSAWALLCNRHFDIVHAHDLLMLPLGAALARRAHVPLIYDAHEIYHLMEAHRYGSVLRWVIARVEQLLIRYSVDVLISVSQQRVDEYWRSVAPSTRLAVVANWYDPVEITPEVRREARRLLGIDSEQFCVAYVGGFTGERRLDLLLEAARERRNVLFVIGGRGIPEIEQDIAKATADLPNVRYLGWVDNPRIVFRAADVLYYLLDTAHPYSRFAASNTLYTSLAYRLPLITSTVGEPGLVMRRIAPELVLARLDAQQLIRSLDYVTQPAAWHSVVEQMKGWQGRFTWSEASGMLRSAYCRALTEFRPSRKARVGRPANIGCS